MPWCINLIQYINHLCYVAIQLVPLITNSARYLHSLVRDKIIACLKPLTEQLLLSKTCQVNFFISRSFSYGITFTSKSGLRGWSLVWWKFIKLENFANYSIFFISHFWNHLDISLNTLTGVYTIYHIITHLEVPCWVTLTDIILVTVTIHFSTDHVL